MFRKPKGKKKTNQVRRKRDDSDDEDAGKVAASGEETTSDLISEARKRLKTGSSSTSSASNSSKQPALVCQPVNSSNTATDTTTSSSISNADLATRGALHLPTKEELAAQQEKQQQKGHGVDGIYRDATRNKFLAGPIKASQNIRVTARFDYQPDVCKDYKQTGFCGFGDTCIYLHDRGDTLSGWQLEQQWEEQQKQKKMQEEAQLAEFMDGKRAKPPNGKDGGADNGGNDPNNKDNLPFACFLSRKAFVDPMVTPCGHYFSQASILDHIKNNGGKTECPICGKDTDGVLNFPTKLVAYKRKVLGLRESKQEDSWQLLFDKMSPSD